MANGLSGEYDLEDAMAIVDMLVQLKRAVPIAEWVTEVAADIERQKQQEAIERFLA